MNSSMISTTAGLGLRPALAENGIRVLGLHELNSEAQRFVNEYCEKELDPLLTPVTVDPAHPFPRVINKALCVAFLLRRRRRSALTYTGVVSVPRALPRLSVASEDTADFIFLADLVAHHAVSMYHGYDIVSSAAIPRHPQQQSVPRRGRGAQPAGVGADRIAQSPQRRRGADGNRGRRGSRNHRTPAHGFRTGSLAGISSEWSSEPGRGCSTSTNR